MLVECGIKEYDGEKEELVYVTSVKRNNNFLISNGITPSSLICRASFRSWRVLSRTSKAPRTSFWV